MWAFGTARVDTLRDSSSCDGCSTFPENHHMWWRLLLPMLAVALAYVSLLRVEPVRLLAPKVDKGLPSVSTPCVAVPPPAVGFLTCLPEKLGSGANFGKRPPRERADRLSQGGPRKLRNAQASPGCSTLWKTTVFDWPNPKITHFRKLGRWFSANLDIRPLALLHEANSNTKFSVFDCSQFSIDCAPEFSIC